jgi:large subunit ribosomal protein L1
MGTLTDNVAAAVQDMRRGRLEFKMDRTGNVHVGLGKVDMPLQHLHLNLGAFCNGLMAAKPAGIKGGLKKLIRSVTVCSSMGKGVRVSVDSLPEAMAAAEAALAGGRAAETQPQPAKAPE